MVAYVRVSSSQQAHSGLGLDAQRSAIQAAASHEGWEIVSWHVDAGETGKHTDRPEFRDAVQVVADGRADGLVAAKLDRVARSVIDFAELLAWFTAGQRTLAILDPAIDTSTSSGRLVANVFAAVAEWEADVIADRTSAALAAKRAQGHAICRPSVADNPGLTARIVTMRERGMTLAKIAEALNAAHIPTVRGGTEWRASSVQAALGYRRPPAQRKSTELPEIARRRRPNVGRTSR